MLILGVTAQLMASTMLIPAPMRPLIPAATTQLLAIRMDAPRASESSTAEQFLSQVKANVLEGELSTRGEGWFIAQACLLLGLVFAPPEPVVPAVERFVGLAAMACGGVLGTAALADLGAANLTPWPKPVETNELQTEGVYSLCRHPMYTSLIAFGFGLSLLTVSFERLLLTVVLFSLLSLKAGREEAFLNEKHGERYRAYAAYVPQLFPTLGSLRDFIIRRERQA